MAHVVMQAAEFPSVEHARRCAKELETLVAEYAKFEKESAHDWPRKSAAPPLIAFGRRHGVRWPDGEEASIRVKGQIAEEANVLQVDRMVFFWIPGFELGGEPMREAFRRLGALDTGCNGNCNLEIKAADPDARVEELFDFLNEEDYEDQMNVRTGDEPVEKMYFSLTVTGPDKRVILEFDDSGVQDWAFVAMLPQLSDEELAFRAKPKR